MTEHLVIRVTAMPTDLNPYGGVFGQPCQPVGEGQGGGGCRD